MKNKLNILAMLVVMFFISGSYKNTGLIEINKDKSVDMEFIYAIDNNKIEKMLDNAKKDETVPNDFNIKNIFNAEEIKKVYEDAGFNVSEYTEIINDNNWEGLKVKKHYNNIDDITEDGEMYFLLNKKSDKFETIDDKKIFGKKDGSYYGDFLVYLDFNYEPGLIDYSKYLENIELKYTVKLPEKVIETNSIDVLEDGKVLNWNLEMGNKNQLSFKFDVPETSFLVQNKNIILIITGALLIVVVLIIVFINKPKKKVVVKNENNGPKFTPLDSVSLTNPNQVQPENNQNVINQNNNNQNM